MDKKGVVYGQNGIVASEKKMNNAVFRTTHEPGNNHTTLSKSRGNDKYPMIPCIHVILRLLPVNIFPQKKTQTYKTN